MDKINVKFTTRIYSEKTNEDLLKFTSNSNGKFDNCIFHFNKKIDSADYWVVFEELENKEFIAELNRDTIFIAGEASSIKKYNQKFLDQFDHVITCQKSIKHKSKFLTSPGHSWFSSKTYDELVKMQNVEKTKLLSIVVSNKAFTKGHRDRLAFCLKLKERFGDKVDLFGRGFNEFNDKWEVIAPYKYSIAIENFAEEHWITEKLGDCYTSLTFPFYYGAPNVSEYYDKESYEIIDIYDFEKSYNTISNILNDSNHYENHLKYLKESKYKYINEYSLIPMISNIINKIDIMKKIKITSSEKSIFPENKKNISYFSKFINRLRRMYNEYNTYTKRIEK